MASTTPETTPSQEFIQMSDEEALYREEVAGLEERGRRLRRAALTGGIFQAIAVVCMIYTAVAIRWLMTDENNANDTVNNISANLLLFKVGIIAEGLQTVAETFVGVLVGLILIGAGINPATSSLIIVCKSIAQAIGGFSLMFFVVVAFFLDDNMSLAKTFQNYAIGTEIVYLLMLMNKYALLMAQVFSGVHLLVLGYTINVWGVFPRAMGKVMCVAGPALILQSIFSLLIPGFEGLIRSVFYLPMVAAQLWLAGWMLVNIPLPAEVETVAPKA